MMKKFVMALVLIVVSFCGVKAQEDAQGCKDHPMFNRMPDFLISQCSENFASLDVIIGKESKSQAEEGTRTYIDYRFNTESQHKNPSWLGVTRNYENAIFKLGGKKIYGDASYATYKLSKDGKETWIMLTFNSGTDLQVEQYYLDILEKEPMKQDITANAMLDELNKSGFIALYINFETGKADIKPESQKIVDQIAEMLKASPSLKVSIEGHTDNVGKPASNKMLSENRAKSVMNAVAGKGIEKTRLSAKGWGMEKPVGDNKTEEGRGKNRRVEIVKK